jgi:hypothetical protein
MDDNRSYRFFNASAQRHGSDISTGKKLRGLKNEKNECSSFAQLSLLESAVK